MGKEAIYQSNISILLVVVFFLGLSSDLFGANAMDFMKKAFIEFAEILFGTIVACAFSFVALIVNDIAKINARISNILLRSAFFS